MYDYHSQNILIQKPLCAGGLTAQSWHDQPCIARYGGPGQQQYEEKDVCVEYS